MTGQPLCLTLAALVSLLLPGNLAAQGLERVPPPIDVHVSGASATAEPTGGDLLVPLGGKVRVSGTTVPLGTKGTQVRIEIEPLSGALATLNAPIAADRSWTATFAATTTAGKYVVTAFSADGKNSATTSFTVLSGDDIDALAAMIESRLCEGGGRCRRRDRHGRGVAGGQGPYPNQANVEKNLADVDAALKELPARLKAARGRARASSARLRRSIRRAPASSSRSTTAVQEGLRRPRTRRSHVRQAGAAAGKTLGVCDRIDAVTEVFERASLWFDLQGLLFEKDTFSSRRTSSCRNRITTRPCRRQARQHREVRARREPKGDRVGVQRLPAKRNGQAPAKG